MKLFLKCPYLHLLRNAIKTRKHERKKLNRARLLKHA
uniref:Uncharacterized protein n=1 Tax=Rhizophora mucronata TaxID=61149 RepID=A0A2P2QZ52_RHIMU